MAVFSLTHADFAAELLEDCRTEFLRVTSTLDEYLLLARHLDSSDSAAIVACAPGNREALVAAAAYAQWLADHIRQQADRWRRADRNAAASYVAKDPDQAVLLAMREGDEPYSGVAPSPTPPPHPAALERVDMLPRLRALVTARELCNQALWAATKSDTPAMRSVCGHIETLLRWLQHEVANSVPACDREPIEVCSLGDAGALALRMLNALPVSSDKDWAATLLASDVLGALLFAGSRCGNGLGMTWVRSVAVTLRDPQYDVSQAIWRTVVGG